MRQTFYMDFNFVFVMINKIKFTILLLLFLFSGTIIAQNSIYTTSGKTDFCFTQAVEIQSELSVQYYSYQWQFKVGSSDWKDITEFPCTKSLVDNKLIMSDFGSAIDFSIRCININKETSEQIISSNTLSLRLLPDLNSGTISSSQVICFDFAPNSLQQATSPSGGTGSYSYQWQESITSSTTDFIDVPLQTGTEYSPTELYGTHFYRLKVKSGDCEAYTPPITVTVMPDIDAPIVPNQTICYNEQPQRITVTPTGAGGFYNYEWRQLINGSYVLIPDLTDSSYQPDKLTSTQSYKVIVVAANGCGSLERVITVTVLPELKAGTINSPQTICYNTKPATLTRGTLPSGGDGNYTYQWQESFNNADFTDVQGQQEVEFKPSNLTVTHYYRLKITSGSSCGTVYTPSIMIKVLPVLTNPVISSGVLPICYNTRPGQLSVTSLATGGDGNFIYQWQSSDTDGNYVDIPGARGITTYQPLELKQSKWYRVIAISSFCNDTAFSEGKQVIVYDEFKLNQLVDQTICYNNSPTLLSAVATGGGSSYNYQWYQSTDDSNYNLISNVTGSTYQPGNLISGTYFKVIVNSNGCGTLASKMYVTVRGELKPGTIKTAQTICYNSQPNILTQDVLPSGGDGVYDLQWQESINNTDFTDVSGQKGTGLQPERLTVSHYYRLKITSGGSCGTVYTPSIMVTVLPVLTAPVISSQATPVCYNTRPEQLSVTTLAKGGDNSFIYQWQSSGTDGDYINIPDAIGNTYRPAELQQSKWYRVKATSSLCNESVFSEGKQVIVYDEFKLNQLTDQIICYNSSPTLLSAVVTGAGNSYNYQWYQSTDNLTYNLIQNETNSTYQPATLTANRYYKVIVSSVNGCGTLESQMLVTVRGELKPGTIKTAQTICYNSQPNVVAQDQLPSGGDGVYDLQWQESINNTNFTDVSGEKGTQFQPEKLTASHYYRLKIISGSSCGTVYTPSIMIKVLPDLTIPIISASKNPICYNTRPDLLVSTVATGGNDSFNYQWQSSDVDGNYVDISGAIGDSYRPTELQQSKWYRVKAISSLCNEFVFSAGKQVIVYDEFKLNQLVDQTICYNNSPALLSAVATGAGNSYNYQWLQSTDNLTYDLIQNETNSTYQPATLTANRYYKVIVSSVNGCGTLESQMLVTVRNELKSGTIKTAQSICYNSQPNIIIQDVLPSGGNGVYDLQWQESINNTSFTDISGQKGTQLQPGKLTVSHYYRLKVTSGSSCGTVYTSSILITVLQDLTMPVISVSKNPICYNTRPYLSIKTFATGGNNNFNYQWQSSDTDGNYVDISGATGNNYQPAELKQNKWYRLKATSTYCSQSVYSVGVQVQVYGEFKLDVLANQSICYNTRPETLNAVVAGAGNSYNYQWYQSINDVTYNLITDATASSYQPGSLTANSYYKVIVSSVNGCGTMESKMLVTVRSELKAGTLKTFQPICYGSQPDKITLDLLPSGGDGIYSYQWQESVDNANFTDISGTQSAEYQPGALTATHYYRLGISSGNSCGTVYTLSIVIEVTPNVATPILGKASVCGNQYETYSISSIDATNTYNWTVDGGDITKTSNDKSTIKVHWTTGAATGKISIETITAIGCHYNSELSVVRSANTSPNVTDILRKPNSNILVCKEDNTDLTYQWGYTVIATGVLVPISDSNRRYVRLPEAFDTSKYSYWLNITKKYSETETCGCTSEYDPSKPSEVIQESMALTAYPNPTSGSIRIKVQLEKETEVTVNIKNLEGLVVRQYILGLSNLFDQTLDLGLPTGFYIMEVSIGGKINSSKIIIK